MRETPIASRHLHVPLQSGDDDVLRAMGRRYTVGQYRAKLERLEDFNLTTDVIVGFPTEDERAFANTMSAVEAAGITKVHVFPYSPRPGTRTAGDDPVAPAASRRTAARACGPPRTRPAASAGRVASGARTSSSSTGRASATRDDYTPWLVDAPIGEMVRGARRGVADEGVLAVVAA